MKTIYKYELKPQHGTALVEPIMMPNNAKILSVGNQCESMCLWAEVDPEASELAFNFEVFGTGHTITEDMGVDREFIGTVFMHNAALVFHVYHRKN
jgi:hypothetical protein